MAAVFLLLMGACLFRGAGRFDIAPFWVNLGCWVAVSVAWMLALDPSLVRERMKPGGKTFNPFYYSLTLVFLAQFLIAGLDVGRYHWSPVVPLAWQAGALLASMSGISVTLWAMRVNRFFSSVVRVQTDRGHVVITSGPYRFVRHPGYAASLVYLLLNGVALGSLAATVPNLPVISFLLYRVITEDRILQRDLPGYAKYANEVRYRLIPGIW
jgi:protein-S-isoprenylcysteine O-methyltransferase Ste14